MLYTYFFSEEEYNHWFAFPSDFIEYCTFLRRFSLIFALCVSRLMKMHSGDELLNLKKFTMVIV